MKKTTITIWTVIFIVLGALVLYLIFYRQTVIVPPISNSNTIASSTLKFVKPATTTPVVTSKPAKTPTPTKVTPPVTTQTAPVTPPAPVNTVKTYTLGDVSTHKSMSSCWTVVEGKVYDLTAFLSSHPAGLSKIMRGCGVDGTQIFNNVGAHSISMLTSGYLGLLK